MRRIGGRRRVGSLVACVAVLLAGGAWSAATIDPRGPAPIAADGQAEATGLGHTDLVDEEAPVGSSTVAVAPPTIPAPPPPAPASSPTTRTSGRSSATTKAPATAGTSATLPPGVPLPSMPFPTKIPNMPPAKSWNVQQRGISVQLWIEPAAPVAGQAVRFHIDSSSAEPCCTIMLDFGDGSAGYGLNAGRTCSDPSPLSPGSHSVVTSHTYATAGAYKAELTVMAKDFCLQPPGPSGSPPPPDLDAVTTPACIAVGPGNAAQKGCSPFPPFGPDTLVSPVIDPFCQVRSDCTKASTPRPGWDA